MKLAKASLWSRRGRESLPKLSLTGWRVSPIEEASAGDLKKNYEVLEMIGQGSSARVFRARRKKDGREVAMKWMEAADEELVRNRRNEFELLRDLKHPNLVQAIEFVHLQTSVVLVLSYHPGSTLHGAVRHSLEGRFAEPVAQSLFRQLVSAVVYLHAARILHRDIKPENILVSSDLETLHLTDFNASRSLREGGSLTMTGTLEYAAPEVLAGESPSEKHDVWGLGLCLHLMVIGQLPRRMHDYAKFSDFCNAVQALPVSCTGPDWKALSEECKYTVQQCLAVDKTLRPAALIIANFKWLQETERTTSRRNSLPTMQAPPSSRPNHSIDLSSMRESMTMITKLLPVRSSHRTRRTSSQADFHRNLACKSRHLPRFWASGFGFLTP
ncbi:MARK3 [Symbiodinium microadriaticum]|nr:MARK3 [Symbiodinium microadriaticum]